MSPPAAGGLIAALTIAVGAGFWGLYWVPLRAIETAGVHGAGAVFLFNLPAAIGAGIVLIIWVLRGAEDARSAVLAGAFAGLGLALYAMGLLFTTVVRATLLFYLTPVWSTLIAIWVLGERPGKTRWAALIIAFTGLALILGIGAEELDRGFGFGEALGLASGFFWAIGAVLIRKGGRSGPALVFHQFFTVLVVGAVAMILLGEPMPELSEAAGALSPMVIGGSLAILLSIYAIFWAVAQVSPGRGGLLMMTEVVVAVISAAIFLPEEALTAQEWAGAALIVAAGVTEVMGGDAEAA